MMLIPILLLLASVVHGDHGSTFEPEDFSVISALVDVGFDVSGIPEINLSNDAGDSASLIARCTPACATLQQRYSEDALHMASETPYTNFTGSYWASNQGEVRPHCIFKPSSREAVQTLVLLSRHTGCPFAVKSGGHAAFPGASSIEGGITVSLERLDQVLLSEDKKLATIGAGKIAYQLYQELGEHELTVLAGRGATIGIGGFTLGGGISFFSSRHGLACDNVVSFEVVTARGEIVTASPTQHPDLFWALRGGGNNFGIVTSFEVETILLPRNELWQKHKIYTHWWSSANLIDAFAHAVSEADRDPDAGLWVAWVKYKGVRIASTQLWHGAANGQDSVVFEKFNKLRPVYEEGGNISLPAMTKNIESQNRYGLRECFYEITTRADPRILKPALAYFWEAVDALAKVQGALPALVWQGFTQPQLRAMKKNGGNPLGLTVEDGPYYNIEVAIYWDKAEDDELVHSTVSAVLTKINVEATALGCQADYVYMNYASRYQDVISSYGAENKARLKSIAQEYDPTGVFQTLQPGYFKLDHAPLPDPKFFSYP
ncbi:FAD binding domain-containing protein [Cryphonectria parasitica EP155]|uniref:FAD binding domain-containing protein n=1 Tax=Cryphonectria parasitica (strain ATCC 38755 / EP155) TaxID=660469 RepID=A0A9P5CNG0_CRYP1|nr:FAD binding domain-containing protein [Cryphonectria parasitica EP155]KAF3765409.1 FAD binding domain-containing protein [Cryphonectria parasitica EP155]